MSMGCAEGVGLGSHPSPPRISLSTALDAIIADALDTTSGTSSDGCISRTCMGCDGKRDGTEGGTVGGTVGGMEGDGEVGGSEAGLL